MAVLCFQQHSRFVPAKSSIQRSALSFQPGRPHPEMTRAQRFFGTVRPDLPCPPPACDFSIPVLCFHRHSRFVPAKTAFSSQLSGVSQIVSFRAASPEWLRQSGADRSRRSVALFGVSCVFTARFFASFWVRFGFVFHSFC